MKSHATHAARARNKHGSSVDFARILRGFCVGFARNLILFLIELEHEGYKRFADCTVSFEMREREREREREGYGTVRSKTSSSRDDSLQTHFSNGTVHPGTVRSICKK